LNWGFFHLLEDEEDIDKKFKMLLETLMGLINPEAYKKYKEGQDKSNTYINDEFTSILMSKSGMTEEEVKEFMKTGVLPNDKDPNLDNILEPLII